jgi:heavy metal sensor kinase
MPTSVKRLRDWPRFLRFRLTILYVALLAIILVGFSAAVYLSLSHILESDGERMVADQARRAAEIARDVPEGPALAEQFQRLNVGMVVGLYDASGTMLLAGRARPIFFSPPADIPPGLPIVETVSMSDGTAWRSLTLAIDDPGRPTRLVFVARSDRGTQAALGQLLVVIGVTIPLTLILAVAVGVFFAGRALDPIDRIARTAEQISAEDLSRRLNVADPTDEVGRLAATFDRMLGRLEDAFQRQRDFTAAASHELRTPLALLVTRAGVALERPRSVAEYQAILRNIRDEAKHMGRVVGDLLLLARADAHQVVTVNEALDLAELVRGVVAELHNVAARRDLRLECRVPEGEVVVEGDQTRLVQLVLNLVDNALMYTHPGGAVHVNVAGDDPHWALVSVSDNGVGISREHLPHIFDRFYRVDRGRGRSDGGAGLGLSMCRWVARAHGGDVLVESEPGRGSTFTVRLPRQAAPAA